MLQYKVEVLFGVALNALKEQILDAVHDQAHSKMVPCKEGVENFNRLVSFYHLVYDKMPAHKCSQPSEEIGYAMAEVEE